MSDLYPYRYAIAATSIVAVALVAVLAWRRGWHLIARRHPKATLITAIVALAIAIPLGNYLLSPLWTRTTLEEQSPLALLTSGSAAQAATSTPTRLASTPPAMALAATPTPAPAAPTTIAPTEPSGGRATTTDEPTTVPAQPTEAPPPEPTATEVPPTPEPVAFAPHVTLSGQFHGADDFHFGQGTALIIEVEPGRYVLRFEEFSVRNGPDLYVYLSTNPDGASANDYNIGALKATDGSFNYDIPPDVDISIYRSVIIWCEPFAVLFATAPLFPVE
ncbi:MAG TPA: DM13 domain-containing protein [Thermomicrobiales bacterium]|nr:DM13 domain-containing protein [Thermomicrobiales bacterium]